MTFKFRYLKLSFGFGGCWRPLLTATWLLKGLVGRKIGFFIRIGLAWFQLTWGAI